MEDTHHIEKIDLTPKDNHRLAALCGQYNAHLQQIEDHFAVSLHNRGHHFHIIGSPEHTALAVAALQRLYADTDTNSELTTEQVHLLLSEMGHSQRLSVPKDRVINTRNVTITPRNINQYRYIGRIDTHDVNFSIGPAGTGKTFLAVACAVQALEREDVERLVLVRPAVEAGEKLGFLPGTMAEKVDPYLRPLYDALYTMLGSEHTNKLIERGIIEIAPLAYMRGRTLNNAFVILDESQNTTQKQMKMLLTRLGFNSKAIITGDITQTDLPRGQHSGLRHAIEVLKDIEAISFTFFGPEDVVRHPLVQRIVQAYQNHESLYED